ncbi:MAG: hypothetical protein NZT92_16765 [Abditibacteriales bacterium]|nr:hypothetical protein [Abditibacteriales bacterium]MDW8367536.1 hypothetical protein [Abditibacteriales bacterium]
MTSDKRPFAHHASVGQGGPGISPNGSGLYPSCRPDVCVAPGQGNAIESHVEREMDAGDTTTMTYHHASKYHRLATANEPLHRTTQPGDFPSDDPHSGNRATFEFLWRLLKPV